MCLFLGVMCAILLCVCVYLVFLLNNRDLDENGNFIPDSMEVKAKETKAELEKLKRSLETMAGDLHELLK